MARVARATGAFPKLSSDEVTQWLIEEAAFLALELEEIQRSERSAEDQARNARLRAMAERQVR